MAKSEATRAHPARTVEVVREGPPLSSADIDDVLSGLEAGFTSDSAGPSVAVVLGHGARVDVFSGHLRACDGEGSYRRERSWNRATARLNRLVIGAQSGAGHRTSEPSVGVLRRTCQCSSSTTTPSFYSHRPAELAILVSSACKRPRQKDSTSRLPPSCSEPNSAVRREL